MSIIDQDGNPQVWKAHYWRHFTEYWDEFSSPEEAIGFLNYGSDSCELSAQGVVWPDGTEREYDWVNDPNGEQMLAREQAGIPPAEGTP